MVRIHNARVQNAAEVVENALTTASSMRDLPLDDGLIKVLRKAKAKQTEERLAAAGAYRGGEYVLSDEIGRPYRPDHIYRRWKRCLRIAKVPHVRLHDARHSCATSMHTRGVPLAVISAWLGHADPSVTARMYLHSDPDALRDAAKTLGDINRASKPETGTR
jgi:integrase